MRKNGAPLVRVKLNRNHALQLTNTLHPQPPPNVDEATRELRSGATKLTAPSDRQPGVSDASCDSAAVLPNSLRQFDRFEFGQLLGSGTFGTVWKAHDTELRRTVAIKIPHSRNFDGRIRQRFARESQTAARLSHDGIVSVYDVCLVDDELPVIVAQYIDGPSLAEFKKQHGLIAPREAASVCADLADALSHAHGHGIVHRDLKPGNILTDSTGKAYITDFGLAKDLLNEIDMTNDGDVLGTASYMSPEQARGLGRQADGRSDLYSLGVILYEMVTGERPFRGTYQMLLLQVVNDPPPPPQRLNASVDKDLQTIILKCMEKLPDYRYQTADELRDDLLRYVNYQPIVARPPTSLERFFKWYPSHATEMLGTYFIVAALLWVFFIFGRLFESRTTDGYELASLTFLPWAVAWIGLGCMILKKGFWFEMINIPVLIAFASMPAWIDDQAQSISMICLISFFGFLLQVGGMWARHARPVTIAKLSSRLGSGDSDFNPQQHQ